MSGASDTSNADRAARVKQLRAARPRNWFVRVSLLATAVLVVGAWVIGPRDPDRAADAVATGEGFHFDDVLSQRRRENLELFVEHRIRPYPVRGEPDAPLDWDWAVVGKWAGDLWRDRGYEATMNTLAISVAAIVAAGLLGLLLSLPAARNVASPQPFLPSPQPPTTRQRWLWKGVVAVTRAVMIFVRAVPEYVWAFLLLTLLGPTAWPAVLALALHNAGILGKLGAEVVENVEQPVPRAMRGLGATRTQIALFGLFPTLMPRFLLFFFYRWETCVREATVLGMLGFATLGFHISQARAKLGYDDELMFFVMLGAVLVLIGDVVSAIARRLVRRAA